MTGPTSTGTLPYHIIMTNDNEINRKVMGGQREVVGLSCVTVASGAEALAALRDGHFDLLMTDLYTAGDGRRGTGETRASDVGHAHRVADRSRRHAIQRSGARFAVRRGADQADSGRRAVAAVAGRHDDASHVRGGPRKKRSTEGFRSE